MIEFYLYDTSTGQIVANGILPKESDLSLQERDNIKAKKGNPNPDEQYVDIDDFLVKNKQENPASMYNNTLKNLPLPCTVVVRGGAHQNIRLEKENKLSLHSDFAGQHRVKVIPDDPKYHIGNFSAYLEPKE